jgi:hypothetical protein
MLDKPGKFIGVPILIVLAGIGAGLGTWLLFPKFHPTHMVLENIKLDQLVVPMVIWANLYAIWNLYHAGAQNFGFLCLYRGKGFKGWPKMMVLAVCIAITVLLGHELGRVLGYRVVVLFCVGAIIVNHWFAAIGLATHVMGRHYNCSPLWFAIGIIAVGGLLVWAFYTALFASTLGAIMALCVRGSFGIWHFLQDRWVWKLSNPQVRATIGADLFAA